MSDRKRNIVINWDPPRDPANSDEIYDKIEGYEIFHNLPQYDSPFVMGAADVSTGTVEVPEGTYSIGIQSYAADGLRSEKVIRNFQITNSHTRPEVSREYDVPLGGVISTECFINATTGIFKTIDATGWSFASAGMPQVYHKYQNGHADRYTQDCSNIASLVYGNFTEDEAMRKSHYILFDASDSNNPLKLVKWEDQVYSTTNNLGLGYWYDAGTGNTTAESTFVEKTGAVTVAADKNVVVGVGTSFTTEYSVGDIIYFSSTKAAKITWIESNTSLDINKTFSTAISVAGTGSDKIKKQGLTVDPNNDAIIYSVRKDDGVFRIFPVNLTLDPDVFSRSRVATLEAAPSLLNFNGTPTLTTSYTNLVLTANGNGFLSPKFKITGTGFNNSEISQSAHSSFQNPTSGKTFVYTLDKVDAFVTTDLEFTVTIAEAADETNTDLQQTASVTIPFMKDGDDSSATAKQNANGYLYYNTQQASPPSSAPSSSNVTYTFSSGAMTGGVMGTGATNWSLTAPTATGGTSDSKMYYIYWTAEEASAGDGSVEPNFGTTIYTATNFTGLVRFNGTNKVEDGIGGQLSFGSTGTTTIDGGKITTGTVSANRISISGKAISDLNNDEGFTDDTVANTKTTAAAVNAAAKTAGSVGGWSLTSSHIQGGSDVYIASAKTGYGQNTAGFWLGNTGSTPKFDIGTNSQYLRWTGSALDIKGNITLDNASSINISGFNNNSGFTNDDVANTKTTAAAAAAAANTAAKTAGSVGGWTISSSYIQGGSGVYIGGAKTSYESTTAGWWIGQASGSSVSKVNIGDSTNYLKWTGSALDIKGNITLDNASSINISGFSNDSGFTDLTAAEVNSANKTAGQVGGWTIDSSAIFSGTKDTSGYTTGGITFNSGGSIHAKEFYIDTGGNAKFKGALEAASGTFSGDLSAAGGSFTGSVQVGTTTLTEANTLNEYTTKSDVDLGNINNPSSAITPLGEGNAAADVNANSTTISGGKITADSISANRIESGNNAIGSSNDKFAFNGATEYSGFTTVIGATAASSSRLAGLFFGGGSNTTPLGAQTGDDGIYAAVFANSSSINTLTYRNRAQLANDTVGSRFEDDNGDGTWCELATPSWAGKFASDTNNNSSTNYVHIADASYALYYQGAIGPFTGSHDALLADSETCVVGDILVDTGVAHASSVSDVITNVTRSTSTNQKAVVGVFVKEIPNHVPVPLAKAVTTNVGTEPNITTTTSYIIDPDHSSIVANKTVIAMNSVGEGQVNVCGENGNIEIGDLIVSSSTTGKGMKQDDDIIRSCTVAKAREAVTFASASTVKQIACIYLCG